MAYQPALELLSHALPEGRPWTEDSSAFTVVTNRLFEYLAGGRMNSELALHLGDTEIQFRVRQVLF